MISSILFLLSLLSLTASENTDDATISGTNNTDCSCGYLDGSNLYTDSIVVYFNETDSLVSSGFAGQVYEHPYENGWNDLFRQGANLTHITLDNQSLALNLSQSTDDHLVMGGAIQTLRQDIHYGTFRMNMSAPLMWTGGSALTMQLYFNETENFNLNLYSVENSSESRITMLMNREFPDSIYGVNYSTLKEKYDVNPWGYTEYRIDWTDKELQFYLGNTSHRNVSYSDDRGLPTVPGPILLKHWSTGNFYAMQGPPWEETTAKIGWIRYFFNSTSMAQSARDSFDERCSQAQACSVDDMSLRGYTSYSHNATLPWKQALPPYTTRIWAISLIAICSTMSAVLIGLSILQREPWKKRLQPSSSTEQINLPRTPDATGTNPSGSDSGTVTPSYGLPPVTPSDFINYRITAAQRAESASGRIHFLPEGYPSRTDYFDKPDVTETVSKATPAPKQKEQGLKPNPAKKRVDYLAGLVAVSSLLVTAIHFCLTFVNASINAGAYSHYSSEVWARKSISSWTLNQNWIGPFLMTSSRFLVASYLRNGNLGGVAEKTVSRTPRMIIPVFAIASLEYFCMDAGATKWLQFLPSVSWSTWPFTVGYANFGTFIDEVLELMYLIPNAAPQITYNYCTGVLWTIPVQLQGSWTVLLAVLVVTEIKTPWKRFAYYAFCIVNNWYGLNWGSYFWLGLMLTDLDLTYKYRDWLKTRPLVYYPLIVLSIILAIGGLGVDYAPQWTNVLYATYEYGIHPDPATGRPIAQTSGAGYPQYFIPRLNGLIFSFGLQTLVELSPAVQSLFSFRAFVFIFPHIFTIYLIHGLVYWSLGATLCITFARIGLPYWANLCAVAVCCYATIFASLPFMTPLVETLGKTVTADIWRMAHEEPAPKRPTLYPWNVDLLLRGVDEV